jgi:predicted Rdx family selenoprotein
LAAEIREQYPNAIVTLIASKGGRFEVVRDGIPIFEKSRLGRHADPGEVMKKLAEVASDG